MVVCKGLRGSGKGGGKDKKEIDFQGKRGGKDEKKIGFQGVQPFGKRILTIEEVLRLQDRS